MKTSNPSLRIFRDKIADADSSMSEYPKRELFEEIERGAVHRTISKLESKPLVDCPVFRKQKSSEAGRTERIHLIVTHVR